MLFVVTLAVRPLLMVHVMPWFSMNPPGWHWTMGKTGAAKGELATHYHPLGGAYDSGDPDVVERQTLLMKIAGFDGMLVDWYGDRARYDYLPNHRVTGKLLEAAGKVGLSFALVYEDGTVPHLIAGGVFKKEEAVAEGKALLTRTKKAWFGAKTYQKVGGKPLFLVFGPQYYPDDAWKEILPKDVAFYTLHHRRAGAVGAYDWPLPGEDWAKRRAELAPNIAIPVAFPRFDDFYKAAGVSAGYGRIPDADGTTYRTTLAESLSKRAPFVQVATWNDWGEGTQIEPSEEFGYRDLEETQRARRRIDPTFAFSPEDLRLPMRLYGLRKARKDRRKLDLASKALAEGRATASRGMLDALERSPPVSVGSRRVG